MTARSELSDFLVARRSRLGPSQAGLPATGGRRRVPGLRREEVASLAGISVEYYIRLERGTPGRVSEEVLDSVSRALRLGPDEHDHLVRLVRAASPLGTDARRRAASRPAPTDTIRPALQRMLDLLPAPAYVRNARFDILASNVMGRALYQPVFDSPTASADGRPNTARYAFLDPGAPGFFVHCSQVRGDIVAHLHFEAARSPYDRDLSDLIGQLCTRSEPFGALWAEQNVRPHRAGTKLLHHPVVGRLALDFEALDVAADQGLRLNVCTADPGSPADESLALLASWAGRAARTGDGGRPPRAGPCHAAARQGPPDQDGTTTRQDMA
ncbi:helix-turn-helix transcriptional regulator [uncultured Propionibacterium sp.]|uniref:helix-turn-helix domain-containing protein n=1 Tax=uncultured Propionibacterium sp. TaxID=218066 RepID=UPI00292E2C58|nr:helix-turn-helix transcriptional regulator [uncultured Propionibacterium sp.]